MGEQEVRPYDSSKDFKLVIDWCLKNHLLFWLKKTRGYLQPTDWINELAKNKNAFIFTGPINGIVEYREIFAGQKGNLARVFFYSPENEAALAQWALEYAFNNGIAEIEYEVLSLHQISKEKYNGRVQPELQQTSIHNAATTVSTTTPEVSTPVTCVASPPNQSNGKNRKRPKSRKSSKAKPQPTY